MPALSVPVLIALAALGEDVVFTRKGTPAPPSVTTQAVVELDPVWAIEQWGLQANRVALTMAATPAYAVEDGVVVRGRSLRVIRVLPQTDPAWVVYLAA